VRSSLHLKLTSRIFARVLDKTVSLPQSIPSKIALRSFLSPMSA
jgi:hypothetical protein